MHQPTNPVLLCNIIQTIKSANEHKFFCSSTQYLCIGLLWALLDVDVGFFSTYMECWMEGKQQKETNSKNKNKGCYQFDCKHNRTALKIFEGWG